MPNQIQIRWAEGEGESYEASLAALDNYDPPPTAKGAVSLKGNYTREGLDAVVALAQSLDVDGKLNLDLAYADAETAARYAGGVSLKGVFNREKVDQCAAVGKEFGLEMEVILTATWGKNVEIDQLRLFPPA